MAKNPTNSHDPDAGLSQVVDTLIQRLEPAAEAPLDAPRSTKQPDDESGGKGLPIKQLGNRSALSAREGSPKPAAVVRARRSATNLRRWAWVRVVLGATLGLAMLKWPYGRSCGMPLIAYLGVVAFIIMTAFWAGVHTWKTRLATGHVVSLVLLAWGTVLAAGEILPRTGYAHHEAAWVCTVEQVPGAHAPVLSGYGVLEGLGRDTP